MNTRAEIALEDFSAHYRDFLVTCDEFESSRKWHAGKYGPMAAYFEADLFAVTLQVMSADGVFERAEAEVLNAMFGTAYTPRELSGMYHSAKPVATVYVDDDAEDALTLLTSIDSAVADDYRDLLLEACRIVSLADGVAEKSERMLIAQLREALS